MRDVMAVLDGHLLIGPGGDGVNAYLYRPDDLTGEIVLARSYETLPPGGNRVIAAVEVVVFDELNMDEILRQVQQSRLNEGEQSVAGAKIRVSRPGGPNVGTEKLLSIITAFRSLVANENRLQEPLVFERSSNGEITVYKLAESSRHRVSGAVSNTIPSSITIAEDERELFERSHGPFEEHIALAAIPGLDWQRLAELGGYTVVEKGREVFRWPKFGVVT